MLIKNIGTEYSKENDLKIEVSFKINAIGNELKFKFKANTHSTGANTILRH